jgi:hypothetical protein
MWAAINLGIAATQIPKSLTQLAVNHQPSHRECRKEQTEQDISGIRPVLHDVHALDHSQRRHQNHKDQIENFVHGPHLA